MFKKKIILKLIFTLFIILNINSLFCEKLDPFSKIKIKSNQASVARDKKNKNLFTCKYIENVFVEFADNSKINSDELEIIIDSSKKQPSDNIKNQNKLNNFKKITFKNNVKIENQNRIIKANLAELYLSEKKMKLSGNVEIIQTKEKDKDIPIKTGCQQAMLDLENEELTFVGNSQTPVCTTIELVGHPGLIKTSKKEKRPKNNNFIKNI